MFGPPGFAYIYLCYGIHHLFNVVTGPVDMPHAVLIRAVQPIDGIEIMRTRRNKSTDVGLTNGPGKWTEAFGITTKNSGIDLLNNKGVISIFQRDPAFIIHGIESTPRIGIDYAEEWAAKPWRFIIK